LLGKRYATAAFLVVCVSQKRGGKRRRRRRGSLYHVSIYRVSSVSFFCQDEENNKEEKTRRVEGFF